MLPVMKYDRSKKSPSVLMQMAVQKIMEEDGLWNDDLLPDIPKSWEKYGDLLLFNGEKYFQDIRWTQVRDLHALWQRISDTLKVKRIALKHYIVNDTFRSPNVKMVFGDDTWVECKDNGIVYTWNIQYNMFCAGNAPERHRISTLQCENEVVVDMYAGIGYFTLPYLVKAKAKLVHACEWNPNAVQALRLNVNKNNVAERCIIHEGDNKSVCPKYIADRVNLGLLPSSECGWKLACEALNPLSGGTLHVHANVTSGIKHQVNNIENDTDKTIHCKTCLTMIKKFGSYKDDNSKNFFSNLMSQSFVVHTNTVTFTEKFMVKWKRVEWKIWALHVCHTLCEMFLTIHDDETWKTVISNIHHVKSYAPHIDHLVLDVKCVPPEKFI